MQMSRTDLDGSPIEFAYHEVQEHGPYGKFAFNNGQMERCYDIPVEGVFTDPSDALTKIRKAFLGWARVSAQAQFKYVQRLPPMADPSDPTLYFTNIQRIEPFPTILRAPGRDDCNPTYSWRVTLTAQHLTYDPLSDDEIKARVGLGFPDDGKDAALSSPGRPPRYVTVLGKFRGRILTLGKGLMKTVSATATERLNIPEGIPVPRNDCEINMVWHAVPAGAVPFDLYQQGTNHIDNISYPNHPSTSPPSARGFFGLPVGCLLFESAEYKPDKDCLGNRVYDVTLIFRSRVLIDSTTATPTPRGWNYVEVVRTGDLVPVQVTSDGTTTGSPPFFSLDGSFNRDFAYLFRPPQ